MCARICSIAQGQIQAEEPVKRKTFLGVVHRSPFFRARQVQLGNRPSPLKVNRSHVWKRCRVSFPFHVPLDFFFCLGFLL